MPDTVPGVGVHWGHKVWKEALTASPPTGSPHQISHPRGAMSSKMAMIPEPRLQYHSSPPSEAECMGPKPSLSPDHSSGIQRRFSFTTHVAGCPQAQQGRSSALEFLLPSSHLNTSLLARTSNRYGSESVCLSGAATSEHKGAKKSPSS